MGHSDEISRRDMLKRSLLVIGAAASAGSVLAACGDDEPAGGGLTCAATDDAQRTMRTSLQYVDVSTDPAKNCLNCQLWQGGQDESTCGTCQVLQGPIAPLGNCASWVAKEA